MEKQILVLGHSHASCIRKACNQLQVDSSNKLIFFNLREMDKAPEECQHAPANYQQILQKLDINGSPDRVVLSLFGNIHNILGMLRDPDLLPENAADQRLAKYFSVIGDRVTAKVLEQLRPWLQRFLPDIRCPVALLIPPPPLEDEAHIRAHPGRLFTKLLQHSIFNPPEVRMQFWRVQTGVYKEVAREFGLDCIDVPEQVQVGNGMLPVHFAGSDPVHANEHYGSLVLQQIIDWTNQGEADGSVDTTVDSAVDKAPAKARQHPYTNLPDYCFWRQSISAVAPGAVDPVTDSGFMITPEHKVATAGSCFAQHISRRLQTHGFQYMLAEPPATDEIDAAHRGFYDFSARFGNVYTARQLLQLFDRAFGYFTPIDAVWRRADGMLCDPFRPRIEPDGYATRRALEDDRKVHLAAVRRMFEQLDVFVFTLGLTECWISRLDGAAYPLAPGVAGGNFNPRKHEFKNFSVTEVVADLRAFLAKLKLVNPAARVLLTVSPVPLVATAEDRHVLVSTAYSKAVLRVAAEEITQENPHVGYFPSYEIITGPHAVGGYFGPDRRDVLEAGVEHVMRVFMQRMTTLGQQNPDAGAVDADILAALEATEAEMTVAAGVACDEEMLAR